MAKIVGQKPGFQEDCDNCGAIVEYTNDDLRPGKRITDDDYNYGDYHQVVKCPKCKKPISVSGVMSAQTAKEYLDDDYDL